MTARRTVWWALTAALTLALLGTTGLGVWQLGRSITVKPADSPQLRQAVLDSARTATVTILSYDAVNADTQLNTAAELLTGDFRDEYLNLVHHTVIPGARQNDITASATVPAAAIANLAEDTATAIVSIDQTVKAGSDPPTDTASMARVGLRKINGNWLIEAFEPL